MQSYKTRSLNPEVAVVTNTVGKLWQTNLRQNPGFRKYRPVNQTTHVRELVNEGNKTIWKRQGVRIGFKCTSETSEGIHRGRQNRKQNQHKTGLNTVFTIKTEDTKENTVSDIVFSRTHKSSFFFKSSFYWRFTWYMAIIQCKAFICK